jgi:hypothetical protein
MGDPQLRSRYDRLRDEREARRRSDNEVAGEAEWVPPAWEGDEVPIVYEKVGEDELDEREVGSSPLYKQYENYSNGKVKSVDIIYGPDVRRLAYEIWLLKANRSNARAARMLYEELEGEMPRYPTAQTIRKWRNEEGWEARASDDIAQVAQHLNRRHFEKLFAMTDEALEIKASIIHNDHPERDSRRLDIISRSVDELLKLRGLGTAGVQGGAEPPKAASKAVEEAGTLREKSAALRDEILSEKQLVAGKKKHR